MTIEMEMEQGRTSAVKEETEHELSRLPTLVMIPAVESMKDILLFKYWFTHPSRYNQSEQGSRRSDLPHRHLVSILLRTPHPSMNFARIANHTASM